ncbi:hypothetical protein PSH92_20985 [Pseudomonas beijingensis]|jgi:hypothetical protein|uniref:Lipoprotein n=1 Tax=Pseudomonas beijingensis TaxID=2954101 RepID=A0ABY9F867_9PSED|nr:hypothetical protein [Pseudomonas sp. FP2034]WLG99816.1 hypothetical protein PSH92_20985 [Pseudomonas sp. FP2034]
MNPRKSVLRVCAWITLISVSGLATVACASPERGNSTSTKASFGTIHFQNDKGEEKCTLPIPETEKRFHFNDPDEYCENNMVSYFWLENVPSATKIQFYDNESCTDVTTDQNTFFFKLQTVKQPTHWAGVTHSIDALRHLSAGELIAGKNLRVDLPITQPPPNPPKPPVFVGTQLSGKNLNERLSCVHIERSQPAN